MATSNKVKCLDDEHGQDCFQQVNVDSASSNSQLSVKDNEETVKVCTCNEFFRGIV